MAPTWIAEEPVVFVTTDGRRMPGRIAVGRPEQVSATEARCPVILDGLAPVWPISGGSPLQALLLAVQFLGMRLHALTSSGRRVVDPDDGSDVGIEALLGPLLRAPAVSTKPIPDES
ncbi:MAG: hypothetical protein H6708_22410 [Kofleriaceae bacterium]|nr:hypothetical protein [Kofleriaceae bacterium]